MSENVESVKSRWRRHLEKLSETDDFVSDEMLAELIADIERRSGYLTDEDHALIVLADWSLSAKQRDEYGAWFDGYFRTARLRRA